MIKTWCDEPTNCASPFVRLFVCLQAKWCVIAATPNERFMSGQSQFLSTYLPHSTQHIAHTATLSSPFDLTLTHRCCVE